jgi:hypothetical protein
MPHDQRRLKAPRKIAIGLALIALLVVVAIRFFGNFLSLETNVRHFATVRDLKDFAGTNDWWAPKFLPQSAHSIRQKFNGDYNTGVFAADFSPADSSALARLLSDVPASEWNSIAPHWGKRVLPWRVIRGDFAPLQKDGFQIAAVRTEANSRRPWYVAVHLQRGLIYAWNVNR